MLTALFSVLLFSLLPVSVWLDERFGAWYVFGVPLLILLLGYGLLWRYRLVFLVLLVALASAGALDRYGDLALGVLLFLAPYAAACIALGYRISERLSPVEWVEPSYPEEHEAGGEPVYSPGHSRPRLNPYADTRPVIVRRGKPVVEGTESKEAQRKEDPCGGDELLDLLLERGTEDPEAEKKLHEYMECRARTS